MLPLASMSTTPRSSASVTSNDVHCDVNFCAASVIVDVASAATVCFKVDNTIYPQSLAAIYPWQAHGSVSSLDGSGASWFNIEEYGVILTSSSSWMKELAS
jgi:hypothetical protein